MKVCIADLIKNQVHKGDVRNTVLRQVHTLNDIINLLNQSIQIKKKELPEYRQDKVTKLKRQITIIEEGLEHINGAIKALQKYKDTSTN